jgi:hypothetical protein
LVQYLIWKAERRSCRFHSIPLTETPLVNTRKNYVTINPKGFTNYLIIIQMKTLKCLMIVFLLILSPVGLAQQAEILTNDNVVEMKTKGLPNSIIIAKIKSSQNSFDISTDALIKLADKKIPEEIVNAIVDAASDNSRHVIQIDPNNPLAMHEAGIYYYRKSGEKGDLIPLESTVYSQSKSGGAVASAMTYGLAKIKELVSIDGSNSRLQLDEQQPEFYFYFDASKKAGDPASLWWFSVATSPNEFLVANMNVQKSNREIETGSANIMGASIGLADKNKTKFNFKKVSPGIYRVFFDQPLNGEYCFMYAGSVPQGFSAISKVYDFGVPAVKGINPTVNNNSKKLRDISSPHLLTKGSTILNLGIGISNALYSGSYYKTIFPPISASLEFIVNDALFNGDGAFGIGGYLAYASSKWSYSYFNYELKYSNIVIGPRAYLHYSFAEKLDTYLGIMPGYNISSSKETGTYPGSYNAASSGGFIFSGIIGARYFFSNKFGGMIEVGSGITHLNLGVALKL